MSEHILYQLSGFVDDRSLPDEADFFDGVHCWHLPSGDPDSLSEFYREHASVLALDGWRLVPVQAVRRLATQLDVATFGKGVSL